jgi:hypothetical protein
MVHVEVRKNKNKYEEVNVRVVTRVGENTGENFEHCEGLGQNMEGKIRKEMNQPPKLNATQNNHFMHDTQKAIEEERECEDL